MSRSNQQLIEFAPADASAPPTITASSAPSGGRPRLAATIGSTAVATRRTTILSFPRLR
jgi:hypothetical protein